MTSQDGNDPRSGKGERQTRAAGSNHGEHGETVVDTVEARQGGRQKMSIHVLVVSMLLLLLIAFAMWFFFMHRP